MNSSTESSPLPTTSSSTALLTTIASTIQSTTTSTTTTLTSTITSMNISTTTEMKDILLDDYMFGSDNKIIEKYNYKSYMDNFFPFMIVLFILACTATYILNIIHIIKHKKYQKSATYQVLVHYFVFKILFCSTEFLTIMSSYVMYPSSFYISPNDFLCFFTKLSAFYLEVCQNFQLLILWLILLSERNLLGFQCLYSDFELKKAMQRNSQMNANGGDNFGGTIGVEVNVENGIQDGQTAPPASSAATPAQPNGSIPESSILKLREKSFKNFLTLNSRHVTFIAFYFLILLLSFYPKNNFYSMRVGQVSRCYLFSFFDTTFILVLIAFLLLYFMPIFFWLIILSTAFSKLFGGERDPNLRTLGESDIRHLKFIKLATFLKFIEEIMLHIISTHDLHLTKSSYELVRILGLVIVLVTSVLFMYFENMFLSLRRRFINSFTNQRVSYRVFRNRGVYEETVDYRNLVENT